MTAPLLDRAAPSRWGWVVGAWAVVLVGLVGWLLATPDGLLREQLKNAQFWSLETCVALGLVVGAIVGREVAAGLERRDVANMGVLGAVALLLTLAVAPRTNRIYYDEQIYQSIGQNLADLKLAQMCNDGTVEYGRLQCGAGEYNKQPYAYPHLLSLAYRLFGVHAATAFVVNALAMTATVCAVYLLTLLLFLDRRAAFFAGLLATLTPERIVWSATAASEPSASLACLGALVAAAQFRRSGTTISLVGTAIATAYAIQFRPESILIVPVVAVLLLAGSAQEMVRPRLWWAALLFVALASVHFGHMTAVRNESWGTSEARLSLRDVAGNLGVNGAFYLGDERFPIIATVLAGIGLFGRRALLNRLTIGLYFLAFFGITLLFYAGSYNYGADVRYSLMTVPPLVVLGGLGCSRVARWVDRLQTAVAGDRAVAAALCFQFLWYVPLVRATTEEAWAARADVRFAKALVSDLPPNSYILTHNPGMFHLWGVNAGQMSLVVSNPAYLNYLSTRFSGGVYLHWNFWCNVNDPVQRRFCETALALRPAETVREYTERDQRVALYRLKIVPAPN